MAIYWNLLCNSLSQPLVKKKKKKVSYVRNVSNVNVDTSFWKVKLCVFISIYVFANSRWIYASSWRTHQLSPLPNHTLTRCFVVFSLDKEALHGCLEPVGRSFSKPEPSQSCSGHGASAASWSSAASWICGCSRPQHGKKQCGEHMRPCCGGVRPACGAALCHYAAHLSFHYAPCYKTD